MLTAVGGTERPHKNVLGQVFSRRGIAGQAQQNPIDQRAIAGEQRVDQIALHLASHQPERMSAKIVSKPRAVGQVTPCSRGPDFSS
jgi:hypothetical protein